MFLKYILPENLMSYVAKIGDFMSGDFMSGDFLTWIPTGYPFGKARSNSWYEVS